MNEKHCQNTSNYQGKFFNIDIPEDFKLKYNEISRKIEKMEKEFQAAMDNNIVPIDLIWRLRSV